MLRWTKLLLRIGVNTRVAPGQIPDTRRPPFADFAIVGDENFGSLIREGVIEFSTQQYSEIFRCYPQRKFRRARRFAALIRLRRIEDRAALPARRVNAPFVT